MAIISQGSGKLLVSFRKLTLDCLYLFCPGGFVLVTIGVVGTDPSGEVRTGVVGDVKLALTYTTITGR